MRHCKYCRETNQSLLSETQCVNKSNGCSFEITYCRKCTSSSTQEIANHQATCQHRDNDLEAKAQRIGLYNFLIELKPWESKAKANITTYIKNFREGVDSPSWRIGHNEKCCKKCVPSDPPADYLTSPKEKYHTKITNTYGDEITLNHTCQKIPEPNKKGNKQKLLKNFEDLINYYQKNLIKQITYHPRNNASQQLAIETNAGVVNNSSIAELPTQIQPVITSYFVDNNNTSLSQQELSNMISNLQRELENENKPTNYLPWILGGVGITALIILIIYLATRPSKRKSY